MDCDYAGLGFGARGIEGAGYIRQILALSIAQRGHSSEAGKDTSGFTVIFPSDNGDSPILGYCSSADLTTMQPAPSCLLMIVDESDTAAIDAAADTSCRAKEAGVYLSIAVCAGSIASSAEDGFVRRPVIRKLRQAVDSLVFVMNPSKAEHTDTQGTRVALALITAILPQTINLIATDIGDIKQVLQGYVVANVARTRHANLGHDVAGQEISSQMDVTSTAFVNPQGLFCAYSASPKAANLEDFEMVGTFFHDAMQAAYPDTDCDLVAAFLLDKSLEGSVEVVTCASFPDTVA